MTKGGGTKNVELYTVQKRGMYPLGTLKSERDTNLSYYFKTRRRVLEYEPG